jgi:hypothetical protein
MLKFLSWTRLQVVDGLTTCFKSDHFESSQTASVDYETDRKIQDTISSEFADRTILCIARLSPLLTCFHVCC